MIDKRERERLGCCYDGEERERLGCCYDGEEREEEVRVLL